MYDLRYEDREDYLCIRMRGPESLEAAIQFWEDLSQKAGEEGLSSFLIVDEVEGKLSQMEIFELSVRISRLFQGATIAYVDPKQDTFELNKFGGLIVLNRGVLARVFKTEEDAVIWLKASKLPSAGILEGDPKEARDKIPAGRMSLDMVWREERAYILVRLTGTRTRESVIAAWSNVTQISKEHRLKPILVEDRLEGGDQPFSFVELIGIVRSMGLSPDQRLAIVDLHTTLDAGGDRPNGTPGGDRGWASIKVLRTVREAVVWLSSGSRKATGLPPDDLP